MLDFEGNIKALLLFSDLQGLVGFPGDDADEDGPPGATGSPGDQVQTVK